MNTHIDQLTEWWENAEQGPVAQGDTVIKRHPDGRYTIREAEKGWENTNYRILARAPKPKPAWHDAVAVIARSVFDETDMYSGRRVMMRAGFGDERWWDSSNEKHWEDDEITDVTPLIEAKVTDEMVDRARAECMKWEFGGISENAARATLTAALGIETA